MNESASDARQLPPGDAAAPAIRVLLVEDSPVERELLRHLLSSDPQLLVVGVAADGEEGVAAAQRLRPDVIVMDIHMPRLDGFAAARQIMESCPTRIVMVTASSQPQEVAATFRALEAGALSVLAKPVGPGSANFAAVAAEFIQTVKLMAEVPVVKRWPRVKTSPPQLPPPLAAAHPGTISLVAIGASTGGPLALQEILARLPSDFPVPLLVVQHISSGFTAGFAEWLGNSSGFPVRIAVPGERPAAGCAYLAPDGLHLGIDRDGGLQLAETPPEYGMRPAAAYLFRSVTAAYGAAAIGVLLTGMGRDGALELRAMRQAGAVTIAQDRDSSIVFGMPGAAVQLGAASYVLPPIAIADTLRQLLVADRAGPHE
ncbi:MAG TPA: chemotaxis-specific protein-glutamate methyltransferase CheB [Azonexus sp.]|nr:chemotaxis-specific protein-glutamate methyltransferase CheB [Azonexus sp.]